MKAAPPARGVLRETLELPSMFRELAFLSVTVLRPHLAKDLSIKYGISSSGGRTSDAKHDCPCSTCVGNRSACLSSAKKGCSLLLSVRGQADLLWYLLSLQTTDQGCGMQGPPPHR